MCSVLVTISSGSKKNTSFCNDETISGSCHSHCDSPVGSFLCFCIFDIEVVTWPKIEYNDCLRKNYKLQWYFNLKVNNFIIKKYKFLIVIQSWIFNKSVLQFNFKSFVKCDVVVRRRENCHTVKSLNFVFRFLFVLEIKKLTLCLGCIAPWLLELSKAIAWSMSRCPRQTFMGSI